MGAGRVFYCENGATELGDEGEEDGGCCWIGPEHRVEEVFSLCERGGGVATLDEVVETVCGAEILKRFELA